MRLPPFLLGLVLLLFSSLVGVFVHNATHDDSQIPIFPKPSQQPVSVSAKAEAGTQTAQARALGARPASADGGPPEADAEAAPGAGVPVWPDSPAWVADPHNPGTAVFRIPDAPPFAHVKLIAWQRININEPATYRAKVPNGWLVLVGNMAPVFIPDDDSVIGGDWHLVFYETFLAHAQKDRE